MALSATERKYNSDGFDAPRRDKVRARLSPRSQIRLRGGIVPYRRSGKRRTHAKLSVPTISRDGSFHRQGERPTARENGITMFASVSHWPSSVATRLAT